MDSAELREDWPSAVSRSAPRRLVRPGAAVETRPAALRYRGQSARRQARIRVVPRRVCLSSQVLGRGVFFMPEATFNFIERRKFLCNPYGKEFSPFS